METARTVVSKEDIKRLLDAEKLKYCFECGICTARCPMVKLLGKDYNSARKDLGVAILQV